MKVFASHNPDSDIRRQSSAGGVFSLLAQDILAKGGVVYGAAIDPDGRVAHRRVDTPEGLAPLRGSKYAYSRIGTAVNDAMADLEAGRAVLFSGTPCQVAAMAKRAGENDRLLLVEVVCHGAPKPEHWDKYLDELCAHTRHARADIRSINFRDKVTGWKGYSLTIAFTDGTALSQKHVDNPYLYAFIKNFTLREACFRCPFKYPQSKADIAIGDLWGIASLAPEIDNDLGTSSVICYTDKGQRAAATLPVAKELTFEDVARHNKALVTQPTKNPDFESFNILAATDFHKACRKYASRPLKHRIIEKFYDILSLIKK
ncbi:MAG: Coenzyme F420 hydrogenase/dehydrogenase, beta subunit C-terminal domain [Pseudoflavonifractor sp.]|nr:Coenzyme F420 hydrogenase/dehydrogenase, beta subunit C-terminal domain [Alloprevotella sp.]MCM1116085.1 Coenzyme F420 hydrogenase/dehydrogenase, beta subunit C-terminal domain [Pseudoflavonifractor sp.]